MIRRTSSINANNSSDGISIRHRQTIEYRYCSLAIPYGYTGLEFARGDLEENRITFVTAWNRIIATLDQTENVNAHLIQCERFWLIVVKPNKANSIIEEFMKSENKG